jgi:nicotinamidase/pyrazinamidase
MDTSLATARSSVALCNKTMNTKHKNYLLALIASLVAILLLTVYCLAPLPNDDSQRLYRFVFDCIPDAFVAVVAIPVVYWLFLIHGISGLSLDPLQGQTSSDNRTDPENSMRNIIPEVNKASVPETARNYSSQILLVVDVQNDFISGSLKAYRAKHILEPVNQAIKLARQNGLLVVFTRDWHPPDHFSFKEHGRHCVMESEGAEIADQIEVPPDSFVANFGIELGDTAYSALENATLTSLLDNPKVDVVFVVGIALNYCVKCTCLSVRELGKETYTIDEAIATATDDSSANERDWEVMQTAGVKRLPSITAFARHLANNKAMHLKRGSTVS